MVLLPTLATCGEREGIDVSCDTGVGHLWPPLLLLLCWYVRVSLVVGVTPIYRG